MYKSFALISLIIIAGYTLVDCAREEDDGEELAKKYCSSCHLFVQPALLDKTTWKSTVLPAMGRLLKIGQDPFEESDRIISHDTSSLSAKEWRKIVAYYVSNAPDKMPNQSRSPVDKKTLRFTIEKKELGTIPTNTYLKIDPLNKWIYASGMDSSLAIFDSQLSLVNRNSLDGILVDMFFKDKPGAREGFLTQIGIMNPNDLKTGSAVAFTINDKGKLESRKVFDTLPRPVQTISADLDVDGRPDYLVCGFGNKEGSFFWMRDAGNNKFEQKMLRPLPGAIKAYIDDVNKDGLPDIIALFAQGQEGIYLFLNRGGGEFETKEMLRFPPVYGSTFFEMLDFNGDGKKDIIYTCGDNADYSKVLKNYHGIYIYLDQGNFSFKQQYFFPLHGAFKALAKDFDRDGDLDIAAISYFPDDNQQPMEGFILLEQTEEFKFTPYSIKEYNEGHWITMDAGDIDADGDDDIVIGSLFLPIEISKTKLDLKTRPLFLLLRNNLIKKQVATN